MDAFFISPEMVFLGAMDCSFGFYSGKSAKTKSLMATLSSSFLSVKLSSGLVSQIGDAAGPMRCSVVGQIEYWATEGRIAEVSGLTVALAGVPA